MNQKSRPGVFGELPRFPLYAKIVLWFSLNLLLLALVAWITFRIQLGAGIDSFLAGYAGERVERVSHEITSELRALPRSEWNEVLATYRRHYGVDFLVLNEAHEPLGTESIDVPPEVRRHLPRPPPLRPPGRAELPRSPEDLRGPRRGPPPDRPPPDRLPHEVHSLHTVENRGPLPAHRRFFVHTTNPTAYWVGIMLPPVPQETPGNRPVVLLARSETLSAGGLFFDFMPWLIAGGGVMLVSVLFWLPLVRNITRSVAQMTGATQQIAAGRFDVRVNENRRDELGRLAESINHLAQRLSNFVSGEKRFLGDIAHELCSPIARVQMALGILEQRADESQKPYLDDLREEVQQMSALVNELLSFSKASLEPEGIQLCPVSLREVSERVVQRDGRQPVDIRIDVPDELVALAAPELITRALSNLVRNAVRYAGAAGPITISGTRDRDRVVLRVTDCGPGIQEEALTRVFDPFYRPEAARARETGGVGLGLAIVKTCVESCGGIVSCHNRNPSGLETILILRAANS